MFTNQVLDHITRIRNQGQLDDAVLGEAGIEGEGPFFKIWLQVEAGVVQRASYQTLSCPSSIACASQLVELAVGRSLELVLSIHAEDVILVLGGLPEGKDYCAAMAVEAIHAAATTALD